jgi:hypothetical protein
MEIEIPGVGPVEIEGLEVRDGYLWCLHPDTRSYSIPSPSGPGHQVRKCKDCGLAQSTDWGDVQLRPEPIARETDLP